MRRVEVVGAVIYNESNEVLCALRSQRMSLPGMWEFPGGKIEPGETHQETLVREIREELSCGVSMGPFITDSVFEYPEIVVHLHTYYARLAVGVPTAQEHERLEWVPVQKLMGLNWAPADLPSVHKVMTDFRAGQRPT